MIELYSLCEEDIHVLQDQERAFYWSGCAELLFRKHGFLSCVKRPLSVVPKGLPIVLRGVKPQWSLDRPMVIEGPVSQSLLDDLGLTAETRTCQNIPCETTNKKWLEELRYTKFMVKRIPQSRAEITEPHIYRDENTYWHNEHFKVQVFKPSGIWRPALLARLSGDESPLEIVAVTDGKRLILGVPLFDIMLYNHAQPALNEGFYKTINSIYLFVFEKWLMEQISNIVEMADISLQKSPIWPKGCQAGLTIRHDYDRPISDDRLEDILAFYKARSIKATWFLLVDKPPSASQTMRMIEEGHEVALHSIAPYFEDFRSEITRFQEMTGVFPLGYSCHGGIGSRGQLALTQHQWSEYLGLLYGEMIGRWRGLPHALLKIDGGVPITGRLILQSSHNSLDLGMKPDAHQLDFLSNEIPKRLREGSHIILMNHPDIHWPELQILIDRLDLSEVWNATLAEHARWARASKFAFNGYCENIMEPSFPHDLKHNGHLESKRRSNPKQVIPALESAINAWYDEEAPEANPASRSGTIKANTLDLQKRIDHLLGPIKDKFSVTEAFHLLDAGCGYGGIPILLSQTYPKAHINAIDVSDRFFRVGQKAAQNAGLRNVSFLAQNIVDLKEHQIYDFAIVSNVLNYITDQKDLQKACANLMNSLKPGGWMVIHTPHFWSYKEPFTKIPFLHFLPIQTRGHISRKFKRRSSLNDVRLPSLYELKRFLKQHNGQVKHNTHGGFFKRFSSTHFTIWVEKAS